MTLVKLGKHQKARIKTLPQDLVLSSRLMEQGFYPKSEITLAHKAPFKGPLAFYLHGAKVSIQQALAEKIEIELA